ncbi:MAG: indoleacetamide hydrolase [Chromatocurvus sp.]
MSEQHPETTRACQRRDIGEQMRALASGETTSEALVRQAIRDNDINARHNIFITPPGEIALSEARARDAERSRGELRGALHGVPLVVKDNIHVAGLPCTAGTATLQDFRPTEDAVAVARLRAAGAVILGKTNMHELAYGITSDNLTFGAVANGLDPECFAGGSSGGSAVAVALGIAAAGLGTDTGGSSRIPAALNGIAGFRPGIGRYPNDGLVMISQTRDTVGPMANSVADLITLDQIVAKEPYTARPAALRGLRLAVPREPFYVDLEPSVSQCMDGVLAALADAGVELLEAPMPLLQGLNDRTGFPLVLYETAVLLRAYLRRYQPQLTLEALVDGVRSPDVSEIMQGVVGGAIPESVYLAARDIYRPALQQVYRDYFAQHDVDAIVFPTVPLTARPIAGSRETVTLGDRQLPTFPTYIRNTDPGSNAGIPGLTLPAGLSEEGRAIGVELDGPEGSDTRLLEIGLALEALLKTR